MCYLLISPSSTIYPARQPVVVKSGQIAWAGTPGSVSSRGGKPLVYNHSCHRKVPVRLQVTRGQATSPAKEAQTKSTPHLPLTESQCSGTSHLAQESPRLADDLWSPTLLLSAVKLPLPTQPTAYLTGSYVSVEVLRPHTTWPGDFSLKTPHPCTSPCPSPYPARNPLHKAGQPPPGPSTPCSLLEASAHCDIQVRNALLPFTT